MNKKNKTLAALLITTCLNGTYAMDSGDGADGKAVALTAPRSVTGVGRPPHQLVVAGEPQFTAVLRTSDGTLVLLPVHEVGVAQRPDGKGFCFAGFNVDGFGLDLAKPCNKVDSVSFKEETERRSLEAVVGADAAEGFVKQLLGPHYAFIQFYSLDGYNPLAGYQMADKNGEKKAFYKLHDAVKRFRTGAIQESLQDLSDRIGAKITALRTGSATVSPLQHPFHIMKRLVDAILGLLTEDSPLLELFQRDIGKVAEPFNILGDVCERYIAETGIQDEVFPAHARTDAEAEVMALDKMLLTDIHDATWQLEKILSFLNTPRFNDNPFKNHINKLGNFLTQQAELIAILERGSVADELARLEAEHLQAERDLASPTLPPHPATGGVHRPRWDLEQKARRAVVSIGLIQEAMRSGKLNLGALHTAQGALTRQYDVLQSPRIWESRQLGQSLAALYDCVKYLNMQVEALQSFFSDATNVAVAQGATKALEDGSVVVVDLRHEASRLQDVDSGYAEVVLPKPSRAALTDAVPHDTLALALPTETPSALVPLGLRNLTKMGNNSAPHLVSQKLADILHATELAEDALAKFAPIVSLIQEQAAEINAERERMATAARVVEVRDPLMDFDLTMMSLVQIKNTLGVTRALAPNHYNIYFAPDLVDTMIQIARGTYAKPLPEGDKGVFIQNLAGTYAYLATHVEDAENLKAILEAYEGKNLEQMHLEYQSDNPNEVPLITVKNLRVATKLLRELTEHKSRLGSK